MRLPPLHHVGGGLGRLLWRNKYFNLIIIATSGGGSVARGGTVHEVMIMCQVIIPVSRRRRRRREIYEMFGITVITANCLNILPFIRAEISVK